MIDHRAAKKYVVGREIEVTMAADGSENDLLFADLFALFGLANDFGKDMYWI